MWIRIKEALLAWDIFFKASQFKQRMNWGIMQIWYTVCNLVAGQFYQIPSLPDTDLCSLHATILPLLPSTDLHCNIHCHSSPRNTAMNKKLLSQGKK